MDRLFLVGVDRVGVLVREFDRVVMWVRCCVNHVEGEEPERLCFLRWNRGVDGMLLMQAKWSTGSIYLGAVDIISFAESRGDRLLFTCADQQTTVEDRRTVGLFLVAQKEESAGIRSRTVSSKRRGVTLTWTHA